MGEAKRRLAAAHTAGGEYGPLLYVVAKAISPYAWSDAYWSTQRRQRRHQLRVQAIAVEEAMRVLDALKERGCLTVRN